MASSKVPPSAVGAFIDPRRIDDLLVPFLPDAEDRAFVVRCVLREGPAHHRGANYVLLSLLGDALEAAGATDAEALREHGTAPVPMRVPPHLARPGSMMTYPLDVPTGPLERLAPKGSYEQAAMVQCLTDGPPQHALANAVMMWLIGALLERLEGGAPSRKSKRTKR